MSLLSFAENHQHEKRQTEAESSREGFYFWSSISPWFCLTYPLHTIQSRFLCVSYIRPISLHGGDTSSYRNVHNKNNIIDGEREKEISRFNEIIERYPRFSNLTLLPLLASHPSPISLNKNFVTVTINSLALVYNKEGIGGLYRGFSLSILHMTARDVFRYLLLRYFHYPLSVFCRAVAGVIRSTYRRVFRKSLHIEEYEDDEGVSSASSSLFFDSKNNKIKKTKSDEDIKYETFYEKLSKNIAQSEGGGRKEEGKGNATDTNNNCAVLTAVGDVTAKETTHTSSTRILHRNLSEENIKTKREKEKEKEKEEKTGRPEEEKDKEAKRKEKEKQSSLLSEEENSEEKKKNKKSKKKSGWFRNIHPVDGVEIFIKYINELIVYPLLTCTTRLVVYEGCDRIGPLEIFDISYKVDGIRGFYGGFLSYIVSRSADDVAEFLAFNFAKNVRFNKNEMYTLKACFSALLGTLATPFSQLSVVQRCQSDITGFCEYEGAWKIIAAMPWKAFLLQFFVSILLLGINSLTLSASLKSAAEESLEFEANEEN